MDENNPYNQQQPGQVVTPPPQQPVAQPEPIYQPPQEQQVVLAPTDYQAPSAQYQPATVVQPDYTQYQQPVESYQPEQAMAPYPEGYAQPVSRRPSLKVLALIAGGITVLTIITVIIASLTGGSIELRSYDDPEMSFTVDVPEGWAIETIDVDPLDLVKAVSPTSPESPGSGIITISRQLKSAYSTPKEFKIGIEKRKNILANNKYSKLSKKEHSNITFTGYGTDEKPGILISYDQKNLETGITTKIVEYFNYESDKTYASFSFVYTPEYASVADSIETIMKSYRVR